MACCRRSMANPKGWIPNSSGFLILVNRPGKPGIFLSCNQSGI